MRRLEIDTGIDKAVHSQCDEAREQQRLATLSRHRILDTAPEAVFDDLAKLAATICATPIAAISLIDAERLWFKAVTGLKERQAPREIAFCDLVVKTARDVVINDASLDPELACNPLVTGESHLRFYAGTPLLAEDGMVMGSVCVLDREPREIAPQQMQALHMLARQAANLLAQRLREQEASEMAQAMKQRGDELERVAEQKRNLLAILAASEARYRTLFDEHPQPMCVYEPATLRFLEVNQALCDGFGHAREELLGMSLKALWPAPDDDEHARLAHFIGPQEALFTKALLRKSGASMLAEIHVKPLPLNHGCARLAVLVDVTERERTLQEKQQVEALAQQSRERLRVALDSAQMGEWYLDFNSGVQQHSVWHDRCFGYPEGKDTWDFRQFLSHVHAQDRARVSRLLMQSKTDGTRYDLEFRVVWPDGSLHWLHTQGQCHLDAAGKPASMAGFVREVTMRVQTIRQLALYKRAIEALNAGVVISDATSSGYPMMYANPAFEAITGYAAEEVIGSSCHLLHGGSSNPEAAAELRSAVIERRSAQVTMQQQRKDGSPFWSRLQVAPVFDQYNGISHYVGILQDISSLVEAERHVAAQARQQAALARFGLYALSGRSVEEIHEEALRCTTDTLQVEHALIARPVNEEKAFFVVARHGWEQVPPYEKVIAADRHSFARLVYDNSEPVNIDDLACEAGLDIEPILAGRALRSALGTVMRSNHHRHGILAVFSRDGAQFRGAEQAFLQGMANILATALDRVKGESDLSFLAHHDMLTGLPNRLMMNESLKQAIERAARHRERLALMFIDLNRFKVINDSLGHHVGDELLKAVTTRIQSCLRKKDLLSRQGGDEYVLLMENAGDAASAAVVAEKILATLKTPLHVLEKDFHMSASIGIAMYPEDATEPDELLRLADAAMYKVKERHAGGGYDFFTRELNALTQDRLMLEHGLRDAIARDELRLVYQPKLDLRKDALRGVEALLRWTHPVEGNISPARFIPVAEATGLIIPISEWVLRQACRQARAWADAGIENINIAVNLSARQFREGLLSQTIAATLEETCCRPEWISIEITESDIMRDAEETVLELRELKRLGISVSIDDFGTGYSSLGYLTRFDVDFLKIDQSFVRDIQHDHDSAAIASAIIALAHSLDMRVVAEGVETEAQLQQLLQWDCDAVQGYLIAKPMEAEACAAMLREDMPMHPAARSPLRAVS